MAAAAAAGEVRELLGEYLEAGRRVLVCYDEPGVPVWHDRLALAPVRTRGGTYLVMTPDADIYAEDLSHDNADLSGVRIAARSDPGVQPDLPFGVPAAQVYGFDQWPTATQLQDLAEEALMSAAALERADRLNGVPLIAAAVVAPLGPGGG